MTGYFSLFDDEPVEKAESYLFAPSVKPLSKEERKAQGQAMRASIIRNLMVGRFTDRMRRAMGLMVGKAAMGYASRNDAVEEHFEFIDETCIPELIYTMLVEDAWDDAGPNLVLNSAGETALHMLKRMQPDDHRIWVAVLTAGLDPSVENVAGETGLSNWDSDWNECVLHYTNNMTKETK